MSVWPNSGCSNPWLSGAEGELISITISIEPRLLEELLEALAGLDFPINPQIYHQAAIVYVYADGEEVAQPATMVEFPAYASRLPEVREALRGSGLDAGSVCFRNMLEDIHSDFDVRPAPAGAPYRMVIRYKHAEDRLRAETSGVKPN